MQERASDVGAGLATMISVCIGGLGWKAHTLLRLLLLLSTLSVAVLAGVGHAATITVDTASDTVDQAGDCSLREAVEAANSNTSIDGCAAGDDQGEDNGDTITFAEELAGQTVTLTQGALNIGMGPGADPLPSLTIKGPVEGDARGLMIDGGAQDRVFDISSDALISSFRLAHLTVTNGRVETGEFPPAEGGGIRVVPTTQLVLDGVRVAGNAADSQFAPARGGGVFAGGPFAINASVISGNTATAGTANAEGGGLHYAPGSSTGVPGQISATEISDNDAESMDGAARGGGIYLRAALGSAGVEDMIRISNSTISGNSASAEGVESDALGGGLYGEGLELMVAFKNTTIAENSAGTASAVEVGGGFAVADAAFELANTLVADNSAGDGSPDCAVVPPDGSATISSLGFNLIGDGSGCPLGAMAGDQVGSDTVPIDPLLGGLGDNGGPTRTHALLQGSPAIDAGNPQETETGCLDADQRGEPRPMDGDRSGEPVCDIGAFEAIANQPPTVVQQIGDQTLSLGSDDLVIDLAPVFEDPEGQPLTFTAESDNPDVATATVEGATLIVTAVSAGTATITVTATDTMQANRRVEVPISDGSGGLNAAAGGCMLVPEDRKAPDPLLWLLIATALGWRYRRRWLAAPHHRRH